MCSVYIKYLPEVVRMLAQHVQTAADLRAAGAKQAAAADAQIDCGLLVTATAGTVLVAAEALATRVLASSIVSCTDRVHAISSTCRTTSAVCVCFADDADCVA
jgi:hypothetical protein